MLLCSSDVGSSGGILYSLAAFSFLSASPRDPLGVDLFVRVNGTNKAQTGTPLVFQKVGENV